VFGSACWPATRLRRPGEGIYMVRFAGARRSLSIRRELRIEAKRSEADAEAM
jgi:hypothetical protein